MDPRRLAAVLAGDAKYIHASGSGYLLTPRLVLTARHVLISPDSSLPHRRIVVVVGHPDHGDRQRRSGHLCWSALARDVALVQLDRPVNIQGEVSWGHPKDGVLDYEALGFPSFARYDDAVERVEHLTGQLPAHGVGFGGGLILNQNAAPQPRPDGPNWGGVSGAAVFCEDCLVGVVVRDDELFADQRLHAVPAHAFALDAGFVRQLEADSAQAPTLRMLRGRRSGAQDETSRTPQSPAPIDELRQLSEEYLRSAASNSRRAGPHGPFFGRDAAIRDIEKWLRPDPGATTGTALVVTGMMGAGKTALLGQTSLAHDEYGRQIVPHWPTAEPARAVTTHLSLVAMDTARLTRLLGAACGVDAHTVADLVTAPAPTEGAVPVVLLDALDDAEQPEQLCQRVLAPLIERQAPPVRLLIGTRSHLLPQLPSDVRTINLDDPEYADRQALERVVRHELTMSVPNSVWRDAEEATLASAVRQVADRAGTSFLLAGLLARTLARRSAVGLPGAEEWRQLAEDGIHGALRTELTERLGERRPWAEGLLRPLAFARGAGLPSAHVWPQAASNLHGGTYTAYDIRELLRVLGDYLVATRVADTEAGGTSFRLFHTALADLLAEGQDADAAHDAIAQALVDAVPRDGTTPDWHAASRYTLDHLATHMRSADTLRALLADPGFLLHSDQSALLIAVNRVDVPRTAQALRATTALRHDTPATIRAQVLQLAARRCGADTLADRLDACCCPPRYATRWSRRRRILDDELPTGFDGGPRSVTALTWRGQPVCVVLGKRHDEDFLQVFDLETRAPVGAMVPTGRADDTRLLGSVCTARGTMIVYRSGDRLRRWSMDEASHVHPDLVFEHEERNSLGSVRQFVMGRLGARTVAVVALWSNHLYCFDLAADSPHPMHEPQPIDAAPLHDLALTQVQGEPAVVCLSIGRVECRSLNDGSLLAAPWTVTGNLRSLILLDRKDRPGLKALAGFRSASPMTDDEFTIDLWDPFTGEILDTNEDYREERHNRWSSSPSYASAWTEEFDDRRRLFLSSHHERHERDPLTGERLGPPCQLRPNAVELTVSGERYTLGVENKRLRLRKAGPYAPDPFDPATWPPGGLRPMTYAELDPRPAEPQGAEPLVGSPARAGTHRGQPVFLVTTPYTGLPEHRTATLVNALTGADLGPPWTIPVPPDEVTAIDWAVFQGRLMLLAFHDETVLDISQDKASVLVWDPERRTTVRRVTIRHPGYVVGVHAPGTADLLYLTVESGPDLLWDLTSDTFTPVSWHEEETPYAFARRGRYVCIPPGDRHSQGYGRGWRMAAPDRAEAVPIHLPQSDAYKGFALPHETLGASDTVIDAGGRTTALHLRQHTYPARSTTLEVLLLPRPAADPELERRRWWHRRKSPNIAVHAFPLEVRLEHVVPAERAEPGRFYAFGGSLMTSFSLKWTEDTEEPPHEPNGRNARTAQPEPTPKLYADLENYDAGAHILHVLSCPGKGLALFTEDGVTFVTDTMS